MSDYKNAERNQEAKADAGKLMLELIPPEALEALGRVLTHGAKKYGANKWQTIDDAKNRYRGALLRHYTAYQKNNSGTDADSGLLHIEHVLCNAMFLAVLELVMDKKELLDVLKYYVDNNERNQEAENRPNTGTTSLNELAKEIHENAINHGWWEEERSFGEIIALCHSELSEALEAYRNKEEMIWDNNGKPDGIAVELADCIIRILDYCGKENIDIENIIKIKHEHNKTRPYKHGGKVI